MEGCYQRPDDEIILAWTSLPLGVTGNTPDSGTRLLSLGDGLASALTRDGQVCAPYSRLSCRRIGQRTFAAIGGQPPRGKADAPFQAPFACLLIQHVKQPRHIDLNDISRTSSRKAAGGTCPNPSLSLLCSDRPRLGDHRRAAFLPFEDELQDEQSMIQRGPGGPFRRPKRF